jgi:hypothetical protein
MTYALQEHVTVTPAASTGDHSLIRWQASLGITENEPQPGRMCLEWETRRRVRFAEVWAAAPNEDGKCGHRERQRSCGAEAEPSRRP